MEAATKRCTLKRAYDDRRKKDMFKKKHGYFTNFLTSYFYLVHPFSHLLELFTCVIQLYCLAVMVNACCVPECKSGYRSNKTAKPVALFKFPKDDVIRQKWIKAIPRKNWSITSNHRVCALHFSEVDFIFNSTDHRSGRKQARNSAKLKRLRIKSTAIPHIFPSLPHYLSSNVSTSRPTSSSTSEARLMKQNIEISNQVNQQLERERVENFSEFKVKIKRETLPSGFVSVEENNSMFFHYIELSNQLLDAPKLLGSVIITDKLEIQMFVSSASIPSSTYNHLLSSSSRANSLKTTTELSNLLSFCKSACDRASDFNGNTCISLVVSLLNHYLSECTAGEQCDENKALVKFIVEQLKLYQTPKLGRRYSAEMFTTAFLWQLTSTALYKKLRELLILPSVSRLRQISGSISVQTGKLDLTYLKERTSHLLPIERKVVLIVDEVYTAQRIEYCNGQFIGLTKDGTPSKTVLTFMVQSIYSKYRDVVCLVPISKLDSGLLREWFCKLMEGLKDFFLVLAVSADNHVCNR